MAVTQVENELGRMVTIAAEVLESGDVQIEVIGPTSTTSNLFTRKEAEAVATVLWIALNPPSFDNVDDLLSYLNDTSRK